MSLSRQNISPHQESLIPAAESTFSKMNNRDLIERFKWNSAVSN